MLVPGIMCRTAGRGLVSVSVLVSARAAVVCRGSGLRVLLAVAGLDGGHRVGDPCGCPVGLGVGSVASPQGVDAAGEGVKGRARPDGARGDVHAAGE